MKRLLWRWLWPAAVDEMDYLKARLDEARDEIRRLRLEGPK